MPEKLANFDHVAVYTVPRAYSVRVPGLRPSKHFSRSPALGWMQAARICLVFLAASPNHGCPRNTCTPWVLPPIRWSHETAASELGRQTGELRCGSSRRSLRASRHPCQSTIAAARAVPQRRMPLLPMPLLLCSGPCGDRHSAAGNGAGRLRSAPFHKRRAARASRLACAVCGFCRAAPRAANPDLIDE